MQTRDQQLSQIEQQKERLAEDQNLAFDARLKLLEKSRESSMTDGEKVELARIQAKLDYIGVRVHELNVEKTALLQEDDTSAG